MRKQSRGAAPAASVFARPAPGVDLPVTDVSLRPMTPRRILLPLVLLAAFASASGEPVRLSATDRAQGWTLLFDGVSLGDWRGYRLSQVPANWKVEAGTLAGREGPALVTEEEYVDFELSFDWKVGAGGHGEVYFHVSEDGGHPIESGPRMDLSGHGPVLAGADSLVMPTRGVMPQYDVWYQAKIYVFGNLVEYWLNGEKVTTYTLDSPSWRAAVAASRYKNWPDFGRVRPGRLALAGAGVQFRNIRVRGL